MHEPVLAAPTRLEVVRVPAEGTMTVAWCGPIHGTITHWDGKRSIGCPGPQDCNRHTGNSRWVGFVAAVRSLGGTMWMPSVVMVSDPLADLMEVRGQYIGEQWKIWRARTGKVIRQIVGQAERRLEKCPPEFPILQACKRFLHCDRLDWDVVRPSVSVPQVEALELDQVALPAPASEPQVDPKWAAFHAQHAGKGFVELMELWEKENGEIKPILGEA